PLLSLTAEDFVREILIKRIHPSYIVEGRPFDDVRWMNPLDENFADEVLGCEGEQRPIGLQADDGIGRVKLQLLQLLLPGVSRAGARSGRSTDKGCGSNVIASTAALETLARACAVRRIR